MVKGARIMSTFQETYDQLSPKARLAVDDVADHVRPMVQTVHSLQPADDGITSLMAGYAALIDVIVEDRDKEKIASLAFSMIRAGADEKAVKLAVGCLDKGIV